MYQIKKKLFVEKKFLTPKLGIELRKFPIADTGVMHNLHKIESS